MLNVEFRKKMSIDEIKIYEDEIDFICNLKETVMQVMKVSGNEAKSLINNGAIKINNYKMRFLKEDAGSLYVVCCKNNEKYVMILKKR